MVRDHIAAVSKQGGFDPASVTPAAPSLPALRASVTAMRGAMSRRGEAASAQATSTPDAGPDASAVPAATAAAGQDALIRGMVARLAARMEQTPGDADGWRRLARAYDVLGDHDRARRAIDRAVRLKPGDADVQLELAEIERSSAQPRGADLHPAGRPAGEN